MPNVVEQLQPDDEPVIQEFLSEFGQRQPQTIWRRGRCGPDSTSEKLYVSEKALEARLDLERVRDLLHALFKNWDKPAPDAEYIRKHCLRTLAILICIGYGRMIHTFQQHPHLHDEKLPFHSEPQHFPSSTQANLFQMFYEKQWSFCALLMQYKMESRLSSHMILPVLQRSIIDEESGSAILYKIQIDEDYNRLQPQNDETLMKSERRNTFVLKTYRTEDARKYYENESDAFKHLRHNGRPPANIIAFYGGYELHNTYNIILEYADGGNLNHYMKRTPPPVSPEELSTFWSEFFNILNGIQTIHGVGQEQANQSHMLLGWHQDVNPDNILVVNKSNQSSPYDVQFKIADLGLSHFKKHSHGPSQATDKDTFGTRAYGAPETHRTDFNIENSALRVKQDVDIWSMGCVTSEVTTWISNGWKTVLEYRKQRLEEVHRRTGRREECFHDGQELLQAVNDMHTQNVANCRRNDELTEPIINRLIPEMLKTSEESRLPAIWLYKMSKDIIKKYSGASDDRSLTKSPKLPPRPSVHRASESGGSTSMYLEPFKSAQPNGSLSPQPPLGSSPNGSFQSLHSTQETLRPRGYSNSNASSSQYTNDQGYFGSKPLNDYSNDFAPSEPSKFKDLSLAETDQSLHTRRPEDWEPPPQLSIQEAKDYLGAGLDFPHKQHLRWLKDRDHAFLIDKSTSAREFNMPMRNLLELLAKMVNKVESGGVSLYFTSDPKKKLKLKPSNINTVVDHFDSAEYQERPDMRSCLAEILNDYARKLGKSGIKNWVKPGCRKLTLYVLTDGNWQPGDDLIREISSLTDHLVKKELHDKQVGIEFIRFGSNPVAIEKLRRLDLGNFNSLNIVDTTPATGNVYKMLLGSINDWFHKDREDDETAVRFPSIPDSANYGSP